MKAQLKAMLPGMIFNIFPLFFFLACFDCLPLQAWLITCEVVWTTMYVNLNEFHIIDLGIDL